MGIGDQLDWQMMSLALEQCNLNSQAYRGTKNCGPQGSKFAGTIILIVVASNVTLQYVRSTLKVCITIQRVPLGLCILYVQKFEGVIICRFSQRPSNDQLEIARAYLGVQ